jgi:hypothetical protein
MARAADVIASGEVRAGVGLMQLHSRLLTVAMKAMYRSLHRDGNQDGAATEPTRTSPMTATITPTTLTSEFPDAGAGVLAPASTRAWLRAEGLAAFVAGLVIFGGAGGPWLLAVPLLLVPDISMIGYLRGPRLGALTYNLVHTWVPGRPRSAWARGRGSPG